MTAGLLLLDKPVGPTSHDLVQRTRRLAGTRRVGHAGTLDPGASGLMILGIDGATRLLTYLVGLDKTYTATIRLGFATTTDDAEGAPLGVAAPVTDAIRARIPDAIGALTGEIDQVPSSVSAVHVDGRRAHERVRAGETVELPSRRVTIRRFDVLATRDDEIDVVVECSSGTYIRALARDLGVDLGVGGHLSALRRTRVGPFDVAEAGALEDPLPLRSPAEVAAALFPVLALDEAGRVALQQGKRLPTDHPDAPVVAAVGGDGALIGLVSVTGGRTRVLMNLPAEGERGVILGFTTVAAIVAAAAAVLAVVLGLAGRKPSDVSLAGPALVELLLLAQLVIALVAPFAGNAPTGSIVEFYIYLVSALVIPPAAIFWALTERTRWSVVVVGIACFAVAVMFVRMQIIWTVQGA